MFVEMGNSMVTSLIEGIRLVKIEVVKSLGSTTHRNRHA
jgi:hypothetical protein